MLNVRNGNRRGKPVEKARHFWPTTKRLISYLRPWKWGVFLSTLMAIVSVALNIVSPKILGQATTDIYDGILKGVQQMKLGLHITKYPIDFNHVGQICLIVVALYVLSGLFSFGQQVLMTWISQKVVYNLRQDFKEKMARVPIKYYDQHSNGDLMSRMVNDMDNISGTLQQGLIQIVTSIITFVGGLGIMLSISWKLTLVACITVPLSAIVIALVAPTAQKLFARQQATLGKINDQVGEIYAGHTIVRTFNKEADEEDKFAENNQR